MKKLALGIATAAVLLTAAPAMAQVGVFAGRHGVGVELGAPEPYPYYGGCGNNTRAAGITTTTPAPMF